MENYCIPNYIVLGKVNGQYGFLFNTLTSDLILIKLHFFLRLKNKFYDYLPDKYKNNLIKRGFLVSQGDKQALKVPNRSSTLTIWLHASNLCNLNCPYCFVKKLKPQTIDVEHTVLYLKKIIKIAKAQGFSKLKIKYSGGEPTLPTTFAKIKSVHFKLVDMAKDANLKLEEVIISNGTNLDTSIIKFLKQEGISIAISLDGWGDTHNKTRHTLDNKSTFKKILEGVELLIKNNNKFNLSVVVHKDNIKDLDKLVKYCLDRKKYIPLKLNFVRDNPNSVKTMMPTVDEMIDGMRHIIDVAKKYIKKHGHNPLIMASYIDYVDITNPRLYNCSAGRSYFTINNKGDISTCHMLLNEPVTNVNKDRFWYHIRNSKVPKHIEINKRDGCSSCPIRFICSGGCPLLTKWTYGTYNHPSPYCDVYLEITKYVLKSIAEVLLSFRQQSSKSFRPK